MGDDQMDEIFGGPAGTALGGNAGADRKGSVKSNSSDMDDLFGLSVGEPRSHRQDSELDNLFGDVGDSVPATPPTGRTEGAHSLEDMDDFINGLSQESSVVSAKPVEGAEDTSELSLGNLDKDEFLSWLEDSDKSGSETSSMSTSASVSSAAQRSAPGSGTASVLAFDSFRPSAVQDFDDEEEDDGGDFYIDHKGATVVSADPDSDREIAAEASSTATPRARGSDAADEGPPLDVLPAPRPSPLEPGEAAALRSAHFEPPALAVLRERKALGSGSTLEQGSSKVALRLETLFEIGQIEPAALRSAVAINGIPGAVLPAELRTDVWNSILQGSRERPVAPDWFGIADDRLDEIFPSVRKGIRRDCAAAWAALAAGPCPAEDGALVDALAGLVCRLVLRHQSKAYNVLLSNLVVTVAWVRANGDDAAVPSELERAAKLLEGLCVRWGGRRGDFESTGLSKSAGEGLEGVGGAAWARATVPLMAYRRHLLLGKLVSFHDPVLAFHLESRCPAWAAAEDPGSPDERAAPRRVVDRVLDTSARANWLSEPLFGLLAPLPSNETQSKIGASGIVALWDAVVLSGRRPQAMALYTAAAILIASRESLLDVSDPEQLADAVRGAPDDLQLRCSTESRTWPEIGALAEALAERTPPGLAQWAAEEELLLRVPTPQQLERFDADQVASKRAEFAENCAAAEARAEAAADALRGADVAGSNPQDEHFDAEDEESVEFVAPSADQSSAEASGAESTAQQPHSAKQQHQQQQTRAGWLSSTLRRKAQNLKTAISKAAAGHQAVDWSKVRLTRRLVELGGDAGSALGITLVKGKYGLEVTAVEPDSPAERTGLLHPGDLVMTLNGLLVLGLSTSDAEALLALQERPFYMVIGTVREGAREAEEEPDVAPLSSTSLCPGLGGRVEAYYAKYNRGKEREVGRILSIYSHRESVLLEELATKYMDHVEGDPCFLPLSQFCGTVDPHDVVRQVCFKEAESPALPPADQPQGSTAAAVARALHEPYKGCKKIFLVDCRSPRTAHGTGRFPTSFELDPGTLGDPTLREQLRATFEPMRGDMQICILGSGSDVLLADFNPARARELRERDQRAVDTCALYFLRLGFPFVGVVEGGFLACFTAVREMGYQLDDCLINMPPSRTVLNTYDAFLRYRHSSPGAAATFLATKARANAKRARSSTAVSYSGAPGGDQGGAAGSAVASSANLAAISSLLSNVWKKPVEGSQPTSQVPASEQPAPRGASDDGESSATTPGAAASSNRFFSSVWRKAAAPAESTPAPTGAQGDAEAAPQASESAAASSGASSSWASGWSSRLKAIKVPDTTGLSSKLRSSAAQAYATAQQKLATVATELSAAEHKAASGEDLAADMAYEEDPAVLKMIASLNKGDLAAVAELGRATRSFEAYKEKMEKKLAKPFFAKRVLVVTPERFLVLDPHPQRPGYGVVKSNRTLKDVARMRYPNNDPAQISLFYNKEGGQLAQTYRFQGDSRLFTKSIMLACARFNSKRAETAELAGQVAQPGEREVTAAAEQVQETASAVASAVERAHSTDGGVIDQAAQQD